MDYRENTRIELSKILTNDCINIRTKYFDEDIKSKYTIGAWLYEPDELVWYSPRYNYIGLIERNPILGNLNGYIGSPYEIPNENLLELKFFLEIEIKNSKDIYIELFDSEPKIKNWIKINNNQSKDYCPGIDSSLLASNLCYRDICSIIYDIQYITHSSLINTKSFKIKDKFCYYIS